MTLCSDFQPGLLTAILDDSDHHEFDRRGLEAYRRNLEANARRALSISFPVVYQLLGETRFADACRQYLRHSPLVAGDWAEWGDSFPEWLELSELTEQLPYLPDMARLDWFSHQLGRTEDTQLNFESLQQLSASNAGAGHLVINPALTLLASEYPVYSIWLAHNVEGSEQQALLKQAGKKLQNRAGETVIIWRKHWRTEIRAVSSAEQVWIECQQRKVNIDQSFEDLSQREDSHSFQFESWLPDAIENHIVIGYAAPEND
ncbi:HvfC/BufC family peptide modification chaperone [Endozoicomonadaceae bacterium StTr2]